MRSCGVSLPGPRFDIIKRMKANAVGKMDIEVRRAYLAGLVDGDGCIMATIEHHKEKKFGFRVRVEFKLTQKDNQILKSFARKFKMGRVVCNRKKETANATYDWIVRDKNDVVKILEFIKPYSRLKKKQVLIALKILQKSILKPEDLIKSANLADTLSSLNVRSKNRRKNFATMIKIPISPND